MFQIILQKFLKNIYVLAPSRKKGPSRASNGGSPDGGGGSPRKATGVGVTWKGAGVGVP